MSFAIPVERGCGRRVEGGAYFESGLSDVGSPIEDFLCDPPMPITAGMKADMGITTIGTSWLPEYLHEGGRPVFHNGQPVVKTWHILDVIGQEHYPTVSQFVEEARRFGVSRRLAANLEWERVTRDTRLIVAHAKAYIPNTVEFHQWFCPKHNIMHKPFALGPEYKNQRVLSMDAEMSPLAHIPQPFCCAGVWWEDEIGEPISDTLRQTIKEAPAHKDDVKRLKQYLIGDQREEWWDMYGGDLDRLVEVKMPSLTFLARKRPEGMPAPPYQLAIFGRFPLGRIAVVKGGESDRNLERASKANVIVEEVDQ